MAFTPISSFQIVAGETVNSGFQRIIAGSLSENTTFSVSGCQEFHSGGTADDIAAGMKKNYSDPDRAFTMAARQAEYKNVNVPAAGYADYIISGNSALVNLTGSGFLGGTATYRIDNAGIRTIDAEKTGAGDTNLCWAATASNMLYWAGWGKDTGSLTVSREDDLLDYYRESFTNLNGYIEAGIEWFLNGQYSLKGEPGAAQLKHDGGGDFFPGITVSGYLSVDDKQATVMTSLDSFLKNGNVCGLNISWLSSGGHAVACWGFSYNAGISRSRKNYYAGVWISDSDDNYGAGRSAPDVIRYCPVSWSNADQAYVLTYQPGVYGILSGVAGLAAEPFTFNVYDTVSGETVHDGTQTVFAGGITLNNIINSGGIQTVSAAGTANGAIVNSGGSMHVSSGGIISGSLTLAGGHVTVAHCDNLQPAAMIFKLAHAKTNDALLTIESGAVNDISRTAFTLDMNGAAAGFYILSSGSNLDSMGGAVFTVTNNNGQNVNMQVGSSYTFADGDKLSLALTDAVTDQLTAAFSIGGGVADTLPPPEPTGLKQTVAGNSVAFDWADSTDKSGIRQYEIQVDNNSNFSSPEYSEQVAVSALSGIILAVGTYCWQVRAQDNSGNWSAWKSSSLFVVTPVDAAGNAWQTAKDISAPDNWVGFGDGADFYKLTMTNAGTLALGLTGLGGNANLCLYKLRGASLARIAASAKTGTLDESVTQMLLAGDYYVKVAPASGVYDAAYTLSGKIDYMPADAAANNYKAAQDISALDNWVGFGDGADFYKLAMTNAGTLTLGLTGLGGNANLYLLNAGGRVLKTSANKGTADEAINNVMLLAGDYYVKVAPADGGRGTVNTNYTLSNAVNYFPTDTAGNTFAAARQVTASGPVSEWLGFGDKDDYYKFELQTAATATLDLTGMTANVNLSLYNSKGKRLAVSAKSGNAAESITRTLAAGTYYARATLAGRDNTDYNLDFNIDVFMPGGLRLFGATGALTGSSDAALTGGDDPLKKNQGILAVSSKSSF
jgi:autotransporter passenger strand-loop-strand repeat protein